MTILKGFVWLLELIPSLRYMSLSHAVNQFANSMQDQMDLTQEAAHMYQFIENFKVLNPTWRKLHALKFSTPHLV